MINCKIVKYINMIVYYCCMTNASEIVEAVLTNRRDEGLLIDWTEGTKNLDSIGAAIAAFATSGGGWLVIGIAKNRSLADIPDKQVLISRVGEALRNCRPIPFVSDPEFIDKDGKIVAVYQIVGLGGTLCEYKDIPYHRVQDSNKKMSMAELRQNLTKYGLLSWELRPSPAPFDAIDAEELEFYLKKINERNPVDKQTNENFLKMNKAVAEGGKSLTNLGLIALGRKPAEYLPQCQIQLVRFRGDKPIDRISSHLANLPARKIIFNCFNFLKLNLPTRERYEQTNRIEEPIIPERALREAIVNMVVHRDYTDPQESLIRIFDDRVEFQNAGAPDKIELEKILAQGIPFHRNQGIYNFLRPVHQAEAAGQGIPIMKQELKRVGLNPPEITTLYNIFHLTLRFAERKPETLGDVVLLYGKEKKSVSTSDVMKIYNLSRPTVIKILDELERKGFAQHIGKTRNSKYLFQ
ncbi:hypothetical protein HY993_01120 [Candidatus Micrarchaeota archaeon]|nr:hypothetical protein [Candidatus Micrarchaeota archaeon]